jgi:hypothetical protein
MTWSDLIEFGRIFNAAVAGLDLVVLLFTIRGWRDRSPGNRFHWSGLALLLFAVCYGSIESLAQKASGGPRLALLSVALVYVGAGLLSKARGKWTEDVAERNRRQEAREVHIHRSR